MLKVLRTRSTTLCVLALAIISCGCGTSPRRATPASALVTASLSLSASSLSFGQQLVGQPSTPKTLTLTNTGNSAVTINNITVDNTSFAVSGMITPAVIPASQAVQLAVTFTPAQAASLAGTMVVSSNASNSPNRVEMAGVGVVPAVNIAPASISFGDQTVATTSASQAITVSNVGTVGATITGVKISPAEFSVSGPAAPDMLPPGQSAVYNVTFRPDAAQAFSGSLTISTDMPQANNTIALSGSGTQMSTVVNVTPTSLDFGSQAIGTATQQTVTVTNGGTSSFTVSNVQTSSPFAVTGFSGSMTLSPAHSLPLTVSFTPVDTTASSGNLTIVTSASSSPIIVPLKGTGSATLAISGVGASAISSSSATINWTTTVASDSQVDYGITSTYGNSTALNSTPVTSHSVSLSGLTANTLYHYRVKSRDASGTLATSPDNTFTTASASTGSNTISAVTASNIMSAGAVISWNTSVASDSQVEYGTTTAYGISTALNPTATTTHQVTLTGLTSDTTYHYRVKSTASGSTQVSGDFSFVTAAWSADMENGDLSVWGTGGAGGNYDSGNCVRPPSGVDTEHVHSGRYSMKMTIVTPPESGCREFRMTESKTGGTFYYSAWFYIDQQYTASNSWNIFQYKSQSPTYGQNPIWVIDLLPRSSGGPLRLRLRWKGDQIAGPYAGDPVASSTYDQTIKDVLVGAWFNIEAYLKQSTPGNYDGRLTVWQDGVLLWDMVNVKTKYDDGDERWSVNNYSGSVTPAPTNMWVDDAVISTVRSWH